MAPRGEAADRPAREALRFKGFGIEAMANGKQATIILLAAACAVGLVYAGLKFADKMTDDHREVRDAMAEMTYVLSLPTAERERLNLAMPESLRRKTRSRNEQ